MLFESYQDVRERKDSQIKNIIKSPRLAVSYSLHLYQTWTLTCSKTHYVLLTNLLKPRCHHVFYFRWWWFWAYPFRLRMKRGGLCFKKSSNLLIGLANSKTALKSKINALFNNLELTTSKLLKRLFIKLQNGHACVYKSC